MRGSPAAVWFCALGSNLLFVALPFEASGQADFSGDGVNAIASRPLLHPLRVDCGHRRLSMPEERERDGDERGGIDDRAPDRSVSDPVWLPDLRWGKDRPYGYRGGERFRPWYIPAVGVWGDDGFTGAVESPGSDGVDAAAAERRGAIYHRGRRNPGSYHFRLPRGKYIVHLGFCELEAQAAGVRVFNIEIEGRRVATDLDPFAVAGLGQAFRCVAATELVDDGTLDIEFSPQADFRAAPIVNAIWIHPAPSTSEPPAPPRLKAVGSYELNALFWEGNPTGAPSVRGFAIQRREVGPQPADESSFREVHRSRVRLSRYLDHDVEKGSEYEYRIASIDVHERQGPWTAPVRVRTRSFDESSLPVFHLELADEARRRAFAEPFENHEIDGSLRVGDRLALEAEVRIRGASTRHAAKKGLRIRLKKYRKHEGFPSPGESSVRSSREPRGEPHRRRDIYLKAQAVDFTLQQEKLACDLFEALSLPASAAQYVHLTINGRYQGIYLDVERVDEFLFRRLGLENNYSYRAATFQNLSAGRLGDPERDEKRERYLEEFFRHINLVERGEFATFVRRGTQWPKLRDYFIATVLCHRSEIEADDAFYLVDDRTRRWTVVPWDHNNGSFGLGGPQRHVGRSFMSIFGQSLQGTGPGAGYWYVLPTRIFDDADLRHEYSERLVELTRAQLLSGALDGNVERNAEALRSEIDLDPYRWPPGEMAPFARSTEELRNFARLHGERILRHVEEERERSPSPLVINEFFCDSEGGWVELHNRGEVPQSFRGCTLSVDDRFVGPRFRLDEQEDVGPGEFRVVKFPWRPPPPLRESLNEEELERRELERRRTNRPFPGIDPRGGTIALLRRPVSTDDAGRREEREEEEGEDVVLDLYFYGPRWGRFSYGRCRPAPGLRSDTFGFLEPTPGAVNSSAPLVAPPLLIDRGVSGRRGSAAKHLKVHVLATDVCGGELDRAELVYRTNFGDFDWQRLTLKPLDDGVARYHPYRYLEARIPLSDSLRRVEYYCIAHSPDGLQRRAPLTAPRAYYEHRVKEVD